VGIEAVAWLVLGATGFVAALRARRSARARLVGRVAFGLLFTVAGGLVNAIYLATGTDYAGFADASYLPFVRDTWRAVVAPDQVLWIGLLVAFELIAGTLVLLGGRAARVGLMAMIAFHVALLSFGWFFWVWAVPVLVALGLLLRAEVVAAREAAGEPTPQVRVHEPV
jgi:hypothetical protein